MSTRRTAAAVAGASALLGLAPAAAHAETPRLKLEREYRQAYAKADRLRADPGRNIIEKGLAGRGPGRTAREGDIRESLAVLRRMTATPTAPSGATPGESTASGDLQAIGACESGGDPTAVDASGTYRGKYQFDAQTWASVGGTGAGRGPRSRAGRPRAGAMNRAGSSPWPVCGG